MIEVNGPIEPESAPPACPECGRPNDLHSVTCKLLDDWKYHDKPAHPHWKREQLPCCGTFASTRKHTKGCRTPVWAKISAKRKAIKLAQESEAALAERGDLASERKLNNMLVTENDDLHAENRRLRTAIIRYVDALEDDEHEEAWRRLQSIAHGKLHTIE